ncbi:ABC transporter permease [Candidatus Dependentiae bacterium]
MVGEKSNVSRFLSSVFLVLTYVFAYAPIVILTIVSFNAAGLASSWGGFSLKWYQKFFSSGEMVSALWASLIIAFASTLLSIVLGFFVVAASKWWQPKWLFSIFYPSVILPEIVMGVGILCLFAVVGAPLGYNSVIAGHTLVGLGFVVPMVRARFEEIDPFLTEASLDLGASYFQTFWRIQLPLLFPTLLAAGFIAFTLSLDDFFIAYFCAGPTLETVSLYVYAQVKSIADPSINALSVVLFLVSALVAFVLVRTKVMDRIVVNE